jgi:hypothetical protein
MKKDTKIAKKTSNAILIHVAQLPTGNIVEDYNIKISDELFYDLCKNNKYVDISKDATSRFMIYCKPGTKIEGWAMNVVYNELGRAKATDEDESVYVTKILP